MFYYTNFILETNAWWLRRVRPVWMAGTAIFCYYIFQRYYFFGKNATKSNRKLSEEEHLRRAQINKRHFGYGNDYYQPTMERSRKRIIMEVMGDSYDRAVLCEDRFLSVPQTFELLQQQIDEENDY